MTVQYLPHSPSAIADKRYVFPWIAALLTLFFGWGVGHFYSRRAKTALALTALEIGLGFALVVVFWALSAWGLVPPARPFHLPVFTGGVTISLRIISAPFAIWAWIDTARRPLVARAGPRRLLGYLALWLAPFAVFIAFGLVTGIGGWSYNPWTGRWS